MSDMCRVYDLCEGINAGGHEKSSGRHEATVGGVEGNTGPSDVHSEVSRRPPSSSRSGT